LLIPTVALSLLLNHEFAAMEILWTFSIYLESVAILPQLFMVQKTGEAESITSHYLFALGIYRFLYILNWVYRYYFEGILGGSWVLSTFLKEYKLIIDSCLAYP
jgi:ER lumen protein retaining receptor